MKKIVLVLMLGVALTFLVAKDTEFNLEFLGSADGPFENTSIQKFRDKKNNVICYLYLPESVSTQTSSSGNKTYHKITTFGGNISCVKEKTGPFGLW